MEKEPEMRIIFYTKNHKQEIWISKEMIELGKNNGNMLEEIMKNVWDIELKLTPSK